MYILIGATGFLGTYVERELLLSTEEDVVSVGRTYTVYKENYLYGRTKKELCDITNLEDVKQLNERYTGKKKIVFLAAYHNPDLVEQNRELAWEINIVALANFLNVLKNVECLFYISTDAVYGNSTENKLFLEDDRLEPVNEYGRQKKLAEEIVLTYGYNVVRYPFLIGPSLILKKKHFYDKLVKDLNLGNPIHMFEDSYRSSLDFSTAARLLVCILKKYNNQCPKVMNICGDQALSKYDIGMMIAKKNNADLELVKKIRMDDSNTIFATKRAKTTLMSNDRVKRYLGLDSIKINI